MNRSTRIFVTRRQRRRAGLSRTPGWKISAGILGVAFVIAFSALLGVTASAAAVAGSIYYYFTRDLPDPSAIVTEQESFETVKIYDRTGQVLLYESIDPRPFRGDRTYVPLEEISPYMINATVALEDRSYWENPGINVRGIARAFMSNLQGEGVQGASSITQQLVKNVLIAPEERYQRSYTRKIKEALTAMEITRHYDKKQILEWYLNNNFYGNFSYGIESAAQVYFDKSARDLDLAESAMLAALPQYPGLNPFQAPVDAKRRQLKVLQSLVEAGYISQDQSDAADAEVLQVRESALERFENDLAPHFALYVLDQVRKQFNTTDDPFFIWRNGLTVRTTLDLDMQREVTCSARQRIAHINGKQPDLTGCTELKPAEGLTVRKEDDPPVSNASVVVLRTDTGEILSMLGALDYNDAEIDGEVNNALAENQPGSAFKPITYATGFSEGLTAASVVMDVRQVFPDAVEPYAPENYDRRYHGPVDLRTALQRSYNIPAVWVLNQVGVKKAVDMAHRLGITTLNKDFYGLSLTLGGGDVKLIDLAYVFATLANGGVMAGQPVLAEDLRPGYRTVDPVSILEVTDKDGNRIFGFDGPQTQRVLSPQLGYLMNDVLSDPRPRPASFGNFANLLTLPDRRIIAKTGTTNDYRDSWTLGGSPQVSVGVWVGNADNKPMDRISGSVGAAPIFNDIMKYAHRDLPVEDWTEPSDMTRVTVCNESGLLPSELCERRHTELFINGTEPKAYDNVYQTYEIDRRTGQLAGPNTPPEEIERKVFRVLPSVAGDWTREQSEAGSFEQPPLPQASATLTETVFTEDELAIARPTLYGYVGGVMDILGNARGGDFRLYQLHFGQGLEPGEWQQIGPDHYNQVDKGFLETWDTTSLSGAYTLRLSVVENSGNVRQVSTPVTIDNKPPTIVVTNPSNGRAYIMEDDEWANINALATDDLSMDRVVFYVDGSPVITTTVAPYAGKWTIRMVDRPLTAGVGTVDPNDPTRLTVNQANGFGIIHDSKGYTETHVFKAVAFDSAGNKTESEPVRIFVQHREDKGPKPRQAALDPQPVAVVPRTDP